MAIKAGRLLAGLGMLALLGCSRSRPAPEPWNEIQRPLDDFSRRIPLQEDSFTAPVDEPSVVLLHASDGSG